MTYVNYFNSYNYYNSLNNCLLLARLKAVNNLTTSIMENNGSESCSTVGGTCMSHNGCVGKVGR